MLRSRLLLLLFSLVLCVTSATAQSAAVQEAQDVLNQAAKLYKERNIESAAHLYQQIYTQSGEALAGALSEVERQVWTKLYVRSGHDLACCYMLAGFRDFAQARELLAAVEGYADAQSKAVINKRMAQTWSMEAMLVFEELDYEASLPLFAHAAEAFHAVGDAPEEAKMITSYAQAQMEMYQYGEALATLAEACRISRAAGADQQLLKALKEEREVCAKLGDSETSARAMVAIDSLYTHSTDYNVRVEYNNLKGKEARSQGRYAVAKTYFLANMEYADRQQFYLRDNFLSLLYGNLRDVCIDEGQYDEALDYAYKALQHDILYQGGAAGRKYTLYSHIARIHSLRGDSVRCESALDSLFLDLPHITAAKDKALLYGQRASCRYRQRRYEAALADWMKSDSVMATSYADDDPERSLNYSNIAGMLCQLKRYDEAERYYQLYADITRATYGEGSDYALYAQLYLANCKALAGHIDEGCRDYVAAIGKMRDIVRRRLPYSSAAERETMWHQCSEYLTNMTAYAIGAERMADDFTRASYEALMLSKAFLLDYERSTFDIVSVHGTPDDLEEYTHIVALNNRLLELQKAPSQNSEQIASLSAQVASLERALAKKCEAYGEVTAFMNIGYEAVQEALGPGDVVLDFTDYVHRQDGRRYAAYVVRAGQPNPLLVPLFAESQVDSLGISHPDMFYDEDVAPALLDLFWRPLAEHVAEGRAVYYVPSHLLFQIALESLPLPDGSLLGDHYRFVRLSSARELVRADERLHFSDGEQRAVLYGGLHYDLHPEVMVEEAAKYEVSPLLAMRGETLDRGTRYTDLAETGREVEAISAALQGRGVDVSVRCGNLGTEESFLSMHGHGPAILHIATHGFFYTPDEANKVDYLKGYDDAMALSGLVLAGGNAAWQGKTLPDGVLDGILTANNIAAMDLRGVDMVVLSACKTAQGEATSEGLFGLQRAFKKAGVQTMVMTLWSVNDMVCREFMEAFYAHLTSPSSRWNKREAFDAARRTIKANYPNPYYWAAFVMLD